MNNWRQRKPWSAANNLPAEQRLQANLSWLHLMALGVGAIVGTGILTLIGVGAAKAGPGVIMAFVIAGAICACAALAYAEMATLMPAAGGAYTYAYIVIGEWAAWLVGWSLILEYSLVVSAVAVGWSGYAAPLLHDGLDVPMQWMQGPELGGLINLPAIFIILVVTMLLLVGTKESASVNALLVVVKLTALLVFIAVVLPLFQAEHFQPFMPFGFIKTQGAEGVERGVMAAAAIIFFAFYGFDAIATAAEETRNPDRDLALGIVGSMLICVAIYVAVAVAALGALDYQRFADSPEPLALILRELGKPNAARWLAASAVIALPTVVLAFFYGQSRIFFAMARDGLLPRGLAKVSPRGTPVRTSVFTAVIVSIIAGVFPLADIAALANAGTLLAFITVSACMLLTRHRQPAMVRKFSAPFAWVTGPMAIAGCLYLFISLPSTTQRYFLIWNMLGIAVYYLYGSRQTTKTS
ncbi:amino acid permease [Methylomonas fluvii]|uniref:Amino acid permease n=1 Tax=Methylomonas fluvii TaxID=1854564 RepID=A0ABR9DFH8_9GAMM|nr:amino acid permease [Methylomonas fluvii]MBD9361845.1 amino acid permease [Methylomonas fluvii]